MMVERRQLEEKVARYEALYALDDTDDEQPDEGLLQSIAMLKRKRIDESDGHGSIPSSTGASVASRKAPKISPGHRILNRTTSAPASLDSPTKNSQSRDLTRSATLHGQSVLEKATEVRVDRPQVPAKLFDGLHFYFFPNSVKNPARKRRIEKAVQHGAKWESEFTNKVTHVVVDRSMRYDQITHYLKIDALPENVHIVDEGYTADCMEFRSILDPTQKRYHIKGFAPPPVTEKPVMRDPLSLELKPAKAGVQNRERQTPSQLTGGTTLSDPPTIRPPAVASGSIPSSGWERPGEPDALDLAIDEAQDLRGMLIDEDDTENEANSSDPDSDAVSFEAVGKVPIWQQKFQCMQQNLGKSDDSPNAETIALLQKMADYYIQVQDEWRPIAYRKAIATLRKQPVKVTTREEAQKLPFIGERLATKIEEIAYTGFLQRLQNAEAEPSDQTLQLFLKVYGIGYRKGMRLIAQGHKTLDDLRTKAELEDNQRIGLEHYDDFNTRIPRAEVQEHSDVVMAAAKKLDRDIVVYTMGSYRRGAETSGDVDLVITHPTWSLSRLRTMLVDSLVPQLFKQKFLKCSLAASSRTDGSKWHGASCLASSTIWRRIDLLLVPAEQLGAALIYFTGNDIFNRSMRLLASKKGMRLNQRGLYKNAMRGRGREKITEGELVEGRDERKIFAALGVPWREPWERIC